MIKERLEKIVKKRLLEFARVYVELDDYPSRRRNNRAVLDFISTIYCGSNKYILEYYRFYCRCRKHYKKD